MYNYTTRQKEAIENMAEALNLSYGQREEFFEEKKDFQQYFEFLQESMKKLKKKINFQNAVKHDKIDFIAIKRKKEQYYIDNMDKLYEKINKYVSQYNPSLGKIKQFIKKKISDDLVINKILKELSLKINDKDNIFHKIVSYRRQFKDFFYIKNKLLIKGFKIDDINECIKRIKEEEGDKPLDEESINKAKSLILKYQRQGKGFYIIKMKISTVIKDNEMLESLIEDLEDFTILENNIQKEKNKGATTQNIIRTFQNKGFKYSSIKKYIF